ncbi:contactin-5-like [Physella acuta]|uniref:contactin-5-like n=1 Tax=Physella acuta TaxID=109671 RepID=UPI0027DD9A16|nr:contactin-5-like [Physella acuta]
MMSITILYQPPSTQNIDYGDTIDLTVIAINDRSENLTYRWKHNNLEFLNPPPFVIYNPTTSEAYITTCNLNIDQYESVRGTYIINVTHNFDYRVVEVNVVLREKPEEDVRLPPNVIVPDGPKVVYKKNKADFSLPCKAKGVPEPSYEWLRDGVPLIVSPQITFDSVRGDITFNDFTTREEGVFTCVARSMFGTTIVKSFAPTYTLKQSRVDEFRTNATISTVADEYTYIKLKCENKGEAVGEEIDYTWYDFNGSKIKIDDRQFIDQNGNLHFAYVTTADGRQYKCGIYATGLSYIQLSGVVLLSIKATVCKLI